MEQRTIRITGTGSKSYKPDLIRVKLGYEKTMPSYEEALNKAAEHTRLVKQEAIKAGVEEGNIRTSSFDVSPKYETYTDKDNNYKRRFKGYAASVSFLITIPLDNKLLSNVLYALKDYTGDFRITYALKDKEKAKEEVIALAVKSAKRKAELLAEASGEKLGDILSIDYSYGRVEFHSRYDDDICLNTKIMSRCGSAPQIELDPEDLDFSDTVNITWSLR